MFRFVETFHHFFAFCLSVFWILLVKHQSHAIWASEILKKYSDFNADNAMEIIRYEVGRVFEQVLEDAGVFKRDKQGKEAFARFVEQLG